MLLASLEWAGASVRHDAAVSSRPSPKAVPPVAKRPSPVAGRVLFRNMKVKWMSQTLIDAKKPELGSWLSESSKAPWGIGCRVCSGALLKLPVVERQRCKWTNFTISGLSIKWCNISRHGLSRIHQLALMHSRDALSCRPSCDPHAAPPVEDFKAALEHKKKGASFSAMSNVAGRSKAAVLTWCLAESVKNIEKHLLKRALCVAIHQDARNGILLVRFSAVDSQLNRLEGVFGLAKDFGTKSKEVYTATLQILRDFCTEHLAPPHAAESKTRFDVALYEYIKNHIELFDADAASDEQRVGRLLRGKSTVDNLEGMPNIKMILRDRAHAATRHARARLIQSHANTMHIYI